MANKPVDPKDPSAINPASVSDDAVPYLIALTGTAAGQMLRIDRTVYIGRGESADIRLVDAAVSHRHAQIIFRSVGLFLTPLRSGSGTTLNDVAVTEPVRLNDGDRIGVGKTLLQVHFPRLS